MYLPNCFASLSVSMLSAKIQYHDYFKNNISSCHAVIIHKCLYGTFTDKSEKIFAM